MHIAFLTSREYPHLVPEEAEIIPALARLGIEVTETVWNDPAVLWENFQAVVTKQCWGYYEDPGKFRSLLTYLENLGIACINSADLIRWNMNKSYLVELRAKGIAVAPLTLVESADFDLSAFVHKNKWTRFVIKPSISAGANNTGVFDLQQLQAALALMHTISRKSHVIIQPFIESIVTGGEWSLVFFAGHFQYGVRKLPKAGDFRSQPTFGATLVPLFPEPEVVRDCQRILESLPEIPAFARVDGYLDKGKFTLMELEMIEPRLFFEFAPAGMAGRFARVIHEWI